MQQLLLFIFSKKTLDQHGCFVAQWMHARLYHLNNA